MQDPDIPPQAEENTNGAVDGVRQDEARAARWAASAESIKAFLPLPWTTATARTWATATAARVGDRAGPVFPHPIRCSILSLCPLHETMPLRGFSPLSKTCSS